MDERDEIGRDAIQLSLPPFEAGVVLGVLQQQIAEAGEEASSGLRRAYQALEQQTRAWMQNHSSRSINV